jgi:NAD(P)-dependent dehydrogenase (short-subunit alcohol dehydrogenase family)
MKIEDSVVLITGANRGLGRALVAASIEAGAKRVYAAARDPSRLDGVLGSTGGRVVALALDVTQARSIETAAARASDVSVLINNAGVLAAFGVLAATPAQIEQDFATNFFGTLATTRAFLPALERGRGALVNVLSVVSLANMPGLGGYSAAKAAAFSVTQTLRSELASRGVSVHGVFPGPIDTDMVREFPLAKTSPEQVAKAILEGVQQDLEDIFPDAVARQMFELWRHDPKALERQLAAM